MKKSTFSAYAFLNIVLIGAICFSSLALVYHVRWFIPYLVDIKVNVVPVDQIPLLWFIVQISKNVIFLIVSLLLVKFFRKYQRKGFYDTESLKVFNVVIISCLGLGLIGAVQTIANNFYEVHFNDWASAESIANLFLRSFTRLLIFKEPQTMYILVAIILWSVKQFVQSALLIKIENEAFV